VQVEYEDGTLGTPKPLSENPKEAWEAINTGLLEPRARAVRVFKKSAKAAETTKCMRRKRKLTKQRRKQSRKDRNKHHDS